MNNETLSFLRVGDVFDLDGREYVVEYINESRARCVPLQRKQVEYETKFGKPVKFETDYAAVNISPNSLLPIKRKLGTNWKGKL